MESDKVLYFAINYIITVMGENIGTPGTFPENAQFLPEKCGNYKFFGIHVYFTLSALGQHKKAEE